jgi:hypothetical protein
MNSAIEYRTLRPGELDQWFDFVAFVFGSKVWQTKFPSLNWLSMCFVFLSFFGIGFGPPNSQKKKREKIFAEASVGSLLL